VSHCDTSQQGCQYHKHHKGTWLPFDGELIGQGKEAAQKSLAEKPALAAKIAEAIMAKRNTPVAA